MDVKTLVFVWLVQQCFPYNSTGMAGRYVNATPRHAYMTGLFLPV